MLSSAQPHYVHEHCLKHHTPEFSNCPWLIFVSKFVPLTISPAAHSHDWKGHQSSCVDTLSWVTQKHRERFSCFVAPCRTSEYSTRRCFAAVVQHKVGCVMQGSSCLLLFQKKPPDLSTLLISFKHQKCFHFFGIQPVFSLLCHLMVLHQEKG